MQKKISDQGKIETATPDDLDDILEIEQESSPNPWKRSFFEAEFSGKFSTILISKDKLEERTDGFIVFRTIDDMAEINNIAVRVGKRRTGIAAGLISRLIDISLRDKITVIFLEVRSANRPAIKLYERSGFKISGRRKGYYNHPKDDALIYKLEIG